MVVKSVAVKECQRIIIRAILALFFALPVVDHSFAHIWIYWRQVYKIYVVSKWTPKKSSSDINVYHNRQQKQL